MKILKISFNHLNSLSSEKGFTIDFTQGCFQDTGLFAITGKNGAGKSTILDAITMALYRQSARYDNDKNPIKIISNGKNECWAEVTIEINNTIFQFRSEISLQRQPKAKIININKNEIVAESITEFKRQVEEQLIGLGYNQFLKTVLLSQGNFSAFLEADSKEKVDILSKLTGGEIYKKLSIEAHEKERQVRIIKEDLQKQINIYLGNILNQEQIDVFEQEIEKIEKNYKIIKENDHHLNEIKNWKTALQHAEKKVQEYELSLNEISEKLTQNQPKFQRLSLHQKASPLKPLVEKWESDSKHYADKKNELSSIESSKLIIEQQKIKADQHFLASNQKLELLTKNWQEFEPKLLNAMKLEGAIDDQETNRQKLLTQYKDMANEIKEIDMSNGFLHEEISRKKVEFSLHKSYLEKHTHDSKLIQQYALIQAKIHQLSDLQKEIQTLQVQVENTKKAQQTSLDKKNNLETDLKQKQNEVAKIDETINSIKQQIEETLAGKTSDIISEEIDIIRRLNERLTILIREISSFEEERTSIRLLQDELKKLHHEKLILKPQLEKTDELLSNEIQRLEILQKLLHIEKEQASFEDKRSLLVEGEPCPLCGSQHHPFAVTAPQFSISEKQIAESRNLIKTLEIERSDLNRKSGEIIGKIQSGKENLEKAEKDLSALKISIENQNKILQAPQPLLDLNSCENYAQELKMKYNELNTPLLKFNQLTKHKEENTDSLLRKTQELESFKQQFTEAHAEYSKHTQNLDNLKEHLSKLCNTEEVLKEEIVTLLNPFHVDYHKDVLAILEERLQTYNFSLKESERLQEDLDKLHQEQIALDVKISERKQLLQNIEHQGKAIKNEIEKLRIEKNIFVGEKKCSDIHSDWQKQLTDAANELKKTQQNQQEKAQELAVSISKLESIKQSVEQILEKKNQSWQELEIQIARLEIQDVETLKGYLLPQNEVDSLESIKTSLEKEFNSISTLKYESIKEFEIIKQEAKTDKNLEQIELEIQENRKISEVAQNRKGQINQILQEHLKNHNLIRQKEDEFEIANRNWIKWKELDSLIGSKDGSAFDSFAQKLTLLRLTEAANHHLADLSQRYLLSCNIDNNNKLELEVIDLIHASAKRTIKSLSGGEKFLISLAMALGLSELAGGKSEIQNLFIDEGFGTLDPHNLELALSTLDALQSQGKKVGIISHVPELNERISARIEVEKQNNGFSKLIITS